MMKSYAQNFEDVILWRALHDVSSGFYIDLGAQHPILDSVSRWFYEQGWRGVHVEPLQLYADLLRQDRPDEKVIQAAVSEEPGSHIIYGFPQTGLSTMSADIAATHQTGLGLEWKEEVVSSLTLAELFEQVGRNDVHWLKVDVEGHERSALASWGDSCIRPWIVLVESTYPNTQVETHEEWEFLLTSRGYSYVYADGLNRYYLHEAHGSRRECFRYPPNYFDHFSLGEHWATHDLRMKNRQELQETTDALHLTQEALQQSAERDKSLVSAFSGLLDDFAAKALMQGTQLKSEIIAQISQSHVYLEKIIDKSEKLLDQNLESSKNTKRIYNEVDRKIAKIDVCIDTLNGHISGRYQNLLKELEYLQNSSASLSKDTENLHSKIDNISFNLDSLSASLHRLVSNRWLMFKALLRPRNEGLLARERISNTRSLLRKVSHSGSCENEPLASFKQKAENHTQGSSSLTEEDLLQAVTLSDLYALPPAEFIKMAYRALLAREADEGGLSHYLRRLALGDSRADVLSAIIKGKEYQSRVRHDDLMTLNNEDFLEAAYRRVLGRTLDEGGRIHYLARLSGGKPKAQILKDLEKSREAQSRNHPMLRLRKQIEAAVNKRDRSGRSKFFRWGGGSRHAAQLDYSLSTAVHRIELDLGKQISGLRTDFEQLTRVFASGEHHAMDRSIVTSPSRPRWVPRGMRLAQRAVEGEGAAESALVHPDFLALAACMTKEAPYGELVNAEEGQQQLDDFMEGAAAPEDHGYGPVRWVGRTASVYLRVTAPRLNVEASGFFGDRLVLVLFGDVVIGTLRFGKEMAVANLSAKDWVGQDVAVSLKCDKVINPASAGISSDQRDLGLLIRSIYFD